MRRVRWLIVLFASGCGAAADRPSAPQTPPEPGEPAKLTEKDAEDARRVVKAFVESAGSGERDAQAKALLDLMPTDKELEVAFPKDATEAKNYYAMIREAIPKSNKLGRKDDEPVIEISIEDARVRWVEKNNSDRKLLAALSPSVLIVAPHVKRKMWSGPAPPFMRVNGRWVVLLETFDLIRSMKLPD